jgi:hypothetical protein
MDRFAILMGRPLPPEPPKPKVEAKYFYGFDLCSSSRDKSVISICHKDGKDIVFDHIEAKTNENLQEVIVWFNYLHSKYPILKGFVISRVSDIFISRAEHLGLKNGIIEPFKERPSTINDLKRLIYKSLLEKCLILPNGFFTPPGWAEHSVVISTHGIVQSCIEKPTYLGNV